MLTNEVVRGPDADPNVDIEFSELNCVAGAKPVATIRDESSRVVTGKVRVDRTLDCHMSKPEFTEEVPTGHTQFLGASGD